MDISYYKRYEPIFGEWKIVREIGEGSFGKVFEIEREDFGYTYKAALKAITIPQSKSEIDRIMDDGMDGESVTSYFRGFVQELVEEFRIMSKLKGESNIVSYEDHRVIEHTDGIGWDILIRMELLTPLTKYTKENILDRDDVISLGIDICKALELCRKNNIIHRDIKPENVFVSENGRFKLGDFGIAKTVEKTTGGLSKKGTYTYMAPEVYKGEPYGSSVDIYSLGIVLYRYMNNNRTPFLPDFPQPIKYADRETAMVRRTGGEAIPAPANADAELAKIILKACAYNPKDRYASPTEMREALESIADETAAVMAVPEAENVKDTATVGSFGRGVPVAVKDSKPDASKDKTVGIFSKASEESNPDQSVSRTAAYDCAEEAATVLIASAEATELEIGSNEKAAVRSKPKKKRRIIPAIITAMLLIAIIIGFAAFRGPDAQADWTEWMDELPRGVSENDYLIEEQTLYRSRDKETASSTESDKMDGWEFVDTTEAGSFGKWSAWSQTAVSASDKREVQKETRYRSRNIETKTSSSSSLDGWELVDTTYEYGDWNLTATHYPGVMWGMEIPSDTRKYEHKTVYNYISYVTDGTTGYHTSSGWRDEPMQYDPSTTREETGTVTYVYEREKTTTYHFQRTGSWSNWSTKQASESSTKQVESAVFYRYRDKADEITYNFVRWTDWSDWSETPIEDTDENEVETQVVYRYKSK